MKVKELIEELKDCNPDSEVVFEVYGYRTPSESLAINSVDMLDSYCSNDLPIILLQHITEASQGLSEVIILKDEKERKYWDNPKNQIPWELYDRKRH